MPGEPGVTVVTTLVCFLFCTQGCGRIARPAFPAPFDFIGQDFSWQNSDASRRGNAELYLSTSLLRRKAPRNDGCGCLKFKSTSVVPANTE
jgi:hypothetical protein